MPPAARRLILKIRMDELVKTFHIDWKLLIAQLVNFGIVLGVLWYFALKPLQKMMHKRSNDIEQSLKDAKEIERKLNEANISKEKIITEARQEAQIVMEKAANTAEKFREEKVQATREELEKIIAKTKGDLQAEKEKMVREARQEVASLVVAASSKVIGKHLDGVADQRLIEESLKEVKK